MSKDIQQQIIRSLALAAILLNCFTTLSHARIIRPGSRTNNFSRQPGTEIVLEAGMVLPQSDLADDYWTTDKGLSATTGYELGGRIRQYFGANWAISPSFHYVDFGNANGVGDFFQGDALSYEIDASLLSYGVDLHIFAGPPSAVIRPYVIGGVSYTHYRYQDTLQWNGTYETNFNAPAFNAGLGIKMRNIELSGTYHFCQFDSSELPPDMGPQTYYWNHVVVRIGFAFGN